MTLKTTLTAHAEDLRTHMRAWLESNRAEARKLAASKSSSVSDAVKRSANVQAATFAQVESYLSKLEIPHK